MLKDAKKLLKKTIKFALTICALLGGIVVISALPIDKIKEKFQKKEK